ncbi:LOW QUALITY PROTEIN: hypothetical protein BT93_L0742 [Corymbia citriodora subsp. variegata]|uniref:F-box domain-containing protein n=1 Tax=Corymbia citriodora subsp. variegata TaxID=360336 RepID=A0A8T0CPC1_CORYI|nr:LOW QUALITY PROTEIN: hypothetical protein BT93_L0742 [Corymbia citriodora subsp. variegata]
MASFPIDVLVEIFLWLSVKPLVRFRCVCKSWNSLLTSPFFIKAYLERSIKLHKFDLLKYDFNNISRVQIHYSPKNELSNLDTSFIKDGEKVKLVGSCNGIVCLSSFNSEIPHHSKIFLWNPSTGENITLPQPSHHVSNLVGFGFNPLSGHPDDFSIVNMNIYLEQHPNYTSQVESFRRNCWKQLGNIFPPSLTQYLGNQVIFKNFICWCPCFYLDVKFVALLILFDVVQDDFQKIALPDIMPLGKKVINLLEGCLSVIAHNSSTENYEVWIMKEFGVYKSWIKLYTIRVSTRGLSSYRPVGFANSREVFFIHTFYMGLRFKSPSRLALYDIQSEKFEAFHVKVNCYDTTQLVTCLESLISLSSTNNVKH